MSDLNLTNADFASISREIVAIAEKYCVRCIVSMLKGGYVSQVLAGAVVQDLDVLLG